MEDIDIDSIAPNARSNRPSNRSPNRPTHIIEYMQKRIEIIVSIQNMICFIMLAINIIVINPTSLDIIAVGVISITGPTIHLMITYANHSAYISFYRTLIFLAHMNNIIWAIIYITDSKINLSVFMNYIAHYMLFLNWLKSHTDYFINSYKKSNYHD